MCPGHMRSKSSLFSLLLNSEQVASTFLMSEISDKIGK